MLKNIKNIISLPAYPQFSGDMEKFASNIQQYTADLQVALEDYSRMLSENIMEQPRWDDFRVPFTRDKQGQSSLPDFDFTNLGLLFPQNDDSEIVYMINQLPHSWKIGTVLKPHVHFIQTGSTLPVYKMDYKLYDNGTIVPSAFTTIETESVEEYTYSSGDFLQILSFPDIDTSHIEDVSAFLDVKFYRDDDIVSGDVLTKEWDFHYLSDSIGSREAGKK